MTHTFYLILLISVFIQDACCGWKIDEIKRILRSTFLDRQKKLTPGPMVKGCNLCVWGTCNPAIKGVPDDQFNAQTDAEELKKAFDHFMRIRKETVISIITSRSEWQRQEISTAYKSKTTFNLVKMINDYVSTDYKRTGYLLSMLAMPLHEFYAYKIFKLIQILPNSNPGDRITVIEIFTTLSPCLIRKISHFYNEKYEKRLADDIEESLKNQSPQTDYIEVIKSLAAGSRDDDLRTSLFKAWVDASKLKSAIVNESWEQKKTTFKEIFTRRSIPQLGETIRLYEKLRGSDEGFKSLEADIEKGMESAREIYGTMVKIIKDQPNYFANALESILYGVKDSDEEKLISFIRGRCDIDLEDIKEAYKKRYKIDLFSVFSYRDNGHGGPFYESMKNILSEKL